MEHGSYKNPSASTFSLSEEDHTLANSLRFVLNKDDDGPSLHMLELELFHKDLGEKDYKHTRRSHPRVTFCGYSIPHPSEAKVNIRVQTTGDHASEVLKDSCQNLMNICEHVRNTFENAVDEYRNSGAADSMAITH